MNDDACFFSGHRNLPPEVRPGLMYLICYAIEELLAQGVVSFYCGGAMGFDQLAAEAVLDMRQIHPELKLKLALPCPDHTRRWDEESRLRFERMALKADERILVSPNYHAYCMQLRNHYMVDRAHWGLCYLTANTGGTASTLAYARRKNRIVRNLVHELDDTPYPPAEVLRMLQPDPGEEPFLF